MGPARKFAVGTDGFHKEQLQEDFQNFHENGDVALPRGHITILPRYHGMVLDCSQSAVGVCMQGDIPFSSGEKDPTMIQKRYKYEFLIPGETTDWLSTPQLWDICNTKSCHLRFGVVGWSRQKRRQALVDKEREIIRFQTFDSNFPNNIENPIFKKGMIQVPIMDLRHCVTSLSCAEWSAKTSRHDFANLRLRVPILDVSYPHRPCPWSTAPFELTGSIGNWSTF